MEHTPPPPSEGVLKAEWFVAPVPPEPTTMDYLLSIIRQLTLLGAAIALIVKLLVNDYSPEAHLLGWPLAILLLANVHSTARQP